MDQSKLFKAFERNKASRRAKTSKSVPDDSKTLNSNPSKREENILVDHSPDQSSSIDTTRDPLPSSELLESTQQNSATKIKASHHNGVVNESTSSMLLSSDVLAKTDLQSSEEQEEHSRSALEKMRNPDPMSVAEMKRNKLVYSGMKNRAVLNAYRELRIQLMDRQGSGNMTVMISSTDVNDNSIITAFNLALSFSLDVSSSALLVDCNPYGTDLQSLVTTRLKDGITDYVSDPDMGLESIIYPTGIKRVSIIPAGNNPSSAVEQFSSQTMQRFVNEIKNRYQDRFIILNAPPVLSSSEARVLTRYCDHTVVTVPYGSADIHMIEEVVEALGAANVTGVVYQQ